MNKMITLVQFLSVNAFLIKNFIIQIKTVRSGATVGWGGGRTGGGGGGGVGQMGWGQQWGPGGHHRGGGGGNSGEGATWDADFRLHGALTA